MHRHKHTADTFKVCEGQLLLNTVALEGQSQEMGKYNLHTHHKTAMNKKYVVFCDFCCVLLFCDVMLGFLICCCCVL